MIDVLRLMVHTGDAPAAPMAPFHSNQEWREGLSLSTSFPLPEYHFGCPRSPCLIPECHLPCHRQEAPYSSQRWQTNPPDMCK